MKKLLAVIFALCLVMAFSMPAAADGRRGGPDIEDSQAQGQAQGQAQQQKALAEAEAEIEVDFDADVDVTVDVDVDNDESAVAIGGGNATNEVREAEGIDESAVAQGDGNATNTVIEAEAICGGFAVAFQATNPNLSLTTSAQQINFGDNYLDGCQFASTSNDTDVEAEAEAEADSSADADANAGEGYMPNDLKSENTDDEGETEANAGAIAGAGATSGKVAAGGTADGDAMAGYVLSVTGDLNANVYKNIGIQGANIANGNFNQQANQSSVNVTIQSSGIGLNW